MAGSGFETIAKEPSHWRERARGHLFLGDVLWEVWPDLKKHHPADREAETLAVVGGIAYHYGMAWELAAKGAIAKQSKAAPPFNHGLPSLSEKADLTLSAEEQELAGRLDAAIVWWGRYPVPKEAAKFDKAMSERLPRLVMPDDRNLVRSVLGRLAARGETPDRH